MDTWINVLIDTKMNKQIIHYICTYIHSWVSYFSEILSCRLISGTPSVCCHTVYLFGVERECSELPCSVQYECSEHNLVYNMSVLNCLSRLLNANEISCIRKDTFKDLHSLNLL